MSETSLHPESSRRRGTKNHLIKTIIKNVEMHCSSGVNSDAAMADITQAVRRYQKEVAR